MADQRPTTAGQDRGGLAGKWSPSPVSHEVDAPIHLAKPPIGDPSLNRIARHPTLEELPARNDAMLLIREHPDDRVDRLTK